VSLPRRGQGSAVDLEKFFRLLFGNFLLLLGEACCLGWVKFVVWVIIL
jgi:hypothetical protein